MVCKRIEADYEAKRLALVCSSCEFVFIARRKEMSETSV